MKDQCGTLSMQQAEKLIDDLVKVVRTFEVTTYPPTRDSLVQRWVKADKKLMYALIGIRLSDEEVRRRVG